MKNNEVELFDEPRKILKELEAEDLTEMTSWQHSFLCGLVKKYRPQKIVEVGVAAGGTTAVLLNTIDMLDIDGVKLFSVDISPYYYRNSNYKTGYLVERAREYLEKKSGSEFYHEFLFSEQGAVDQLEYIGKDIDFLILDTAHVLPGEILDFLAFLPYLTESAIVVLHDIILQYETSRSSFATQLLMDTVVADKIIGNDVSEKGGYPNIGAFRINKDTKKYIGDTFSALLIPWEYIPSHDSLKKYGELYRHYYTENEVSLYELACALNKKEEIKRKVTSDAGIKALFQLLKLIGSRCCYIYGDGVVGQRLHFCLEAASINVTGHVVSDNQLITSDRTIHLRDLKLGKDDVLIIGVSNGLKGEIVSLIENENISNYISLEPEMYTFLKLLYM